MCVYVHILTEVLLDERVVSQRNALLSDLAVSALVDELTHRLEVGVSEGQNHTRVTYYTWAHVTPKSPTLHPETGFLQEKPALTPRSTQPKQVEPAV